MLKSSRLRSLLNKLENRIKKKDKPSRLNSKNFLKFYKLCNSETKYLKAHKISKPSKPKHSSGRTPNVRLLTAQKRP